MKVLSALAAVLLAVTSAIPGCATQSQDAGWITLIDGTVKSLENWNRLGDANWRVEDGAIVADKGKGGHLVSKSSYKDFQIRAEFWADHTTNSGIFFRVSDPSKIGSVSAYEVNIFDQRPTHGTAAIVDIAEASPLQKAGGKWNTMLITAQGPRLVVEFNGQRTVDTQHSKFTQGPFSLQFNNLPKDVPGGAIKWRKVEIRPL